MLSPKIPDVETLWDNFIRKQRRMFIRIVQQKGNSNVLRKACEVLYQDLWLMDMKQMV